MEQASAALPSSPGSKSQCQPQYTAIAWKWEPGVSKVIFLCSISVRSATDSFKSPCFVTPRSSQALPPVRQFVSISIVTLVSPFTSSLVPSLQAYAVSFLCLPCVPLLLCRCRYSYRCHCHRRCRCRCRGTTPRVQALRRWRGRARYVSLRMFTCARVYAAVLCV